MNPFASRLFPLLTGGRELFGTVIKHGKMDKTVTVKCDFKHWNGYASKVMHSSSKFLAHDHDNSLMAGDKVILQYAGDKISPRKHYFVRETVMPFPRMELPKKTQTPQEMLLQTVYKQEYKALLSKSDPKSLRTISQKTQYRRAQKARAMAKAVGRLNKMEKANSSLE